MSCKYKAEAAESNCCSTRYYADLCGPRREEDADFLMGNLVELNVAGGEEGALRQLAVRQRPHDWQLRRREARTGEGKKTEDEQDGIIKGNLGGYKQPASTFFTHSPPPQASHRQRMHLWLTI